MSNKITIDRTDLFYIERAMDTAMSELYAYVEEGATKEDVLFDMEQAHEIVRRLLGGK